MRKSRLQHQNRTSGILTAVQIVFYRVVESDPPTDDDFKSEQELGNNPRRQPNARVLRLWSGVSVYKNEWEARSLLVGRTHIGRFIAELRIPADADVRVQFDSSRYGHCTLWGDAHHLRGFVEAVVPA